MAANRMSLTLLLALPAVSVARTPLLSSSRLSVITPTAEVAPSLNEPRPEALLQDDAVHTKGLKTKYGPKAAAWFGGFSNAESTFTYDGQYEDRDINKEIEVRDGWYPKVANPFADRVKEARWFQETKSAGPKEPWQTFFPPLRKTVAGNEVETGKWFEGTGGVWQQDYRPAGSLPTGDLDASWFDDSVRQVDGFGRRKFPDLDSPRLDFAWEEKSVNTSMTCKAAGCTARASLLAPFDSSKEIAKNCRLSVFFHPTDFDDEFIGEHVTWVQVNNHKVSTKCRPYADGCNNTASRPLVPCASDIPVDKLMKSNGALSIAAKINDVVDECPYNGNMLSAVPIVTCLVAQKPKGRQLTPAAKVKAKLVAEQEANCVMKMPLQCATKGCVSKIRIPVNNTCAKLGKCMLSINVTQTDFDNKDGTSEIIEYIKVNGKDVAKKLKPGQNPCKSKWHGKPIKLAQETFPALKNHVLKITEGQVLVEGKISKFVDECPSNGNLFDAVAEVTCKKK